MLANAADLIGDGFLTRIRALHEGPSRIYHGWSHIEALLALFDLPPATLARTVRLIEATATHTIPPGLDAAEAADTARFLDMDLSVLGAPEATFDCYEAGVRAEYAHVAEPAFRAGRATILERCLARDPLFLSARGQGRFEAAARVNLRRSLDALRRHRRYARSSGS